jgi:hypothetical protein
MASGIQTEGCRRVAILLVVIGASTCAGNRLAHSCFNSVLGARRIEKCLFVLVLPAGWPEQRGEHVPVLGRGAAGACRPAATLTTPAAQTCCCLCSCDWLQGGLSNVVSMFLYLVEEQLAPAGLPPPPPPQETPQTGCLHPAKPGYYWNGPADYMAW